MLVYCYGFMLALSWIYIAGILFICAIKRHIFTQNRMVLSDKRQTIMKLM